MSVCVCVCVCVCDILEREVIDGGVATNIRVSERVTRQALR